MKIKWQWSLDLEAKRLVEMCHHTASDFFRLHHFLPLPFDLNVKRSNTSHHVYLPNLNYSSIPRFWEEMVRINTLSPIQPNSFDTGLLIPHLKQLELKPLKLSDLKTIADQYLPITNDWLKTTFPTLTLPNNVSIILSYFGTGGSFDWSTDNKDITLSLRHDSDLHALIEIYLSAILRPQVGNTLYRDWEKSEYLVDYLLLKSSLSGLLPTPSTWQPTTVPPYFSQKLISESNSFLQKIGAPNIRSSRFSLNNNEIYFGKSQLTCFTAKEQSILTKLISQSPAPLTIDEIADIIFSSDSKFSLSAVTKTIERLRKKLADLGISSSYIATASGIGYYLKN